MGKEEHFKEHPNDKPLNEFEAKLMGKIGELRHKNKIANILSYIHVELLKSQIRADANIKNEFIEMFPNEYRLALSESMKKHEPTKKRMVRRLEIINEMNLKDPNILNKYMKNWRNNDTTI